MKRLMLLAALALGGCDHPDSWEFQVYLVSDTPPEKLVQLRDILNERGYRQVRITPINFGKSILIQATAREGGAE